MSLEVTAIAKHRFEWAIPVATLLLSIAAPLCAGSIWQASPFAFALLAAIYGFVSLMSWLLIHECVHWKLLWRPRANLYWGRALAVLFGCPLAVLRTGHLLHHAQRHKSLAGFRPGLPGSRLARLRAIAYYVGILGGFHVAQQTMAYALSVPFAVALAKRHWPARSLQGLFLRAVLKRIWEIRLDTTLCAVWLACAFAVNADTPGPLLILLAIKAFVISYHDNLYHHGLPPPARHAGHNIAMPSWLARSLLNSNYHRVHHAFPSAGWRSLPDLAQRHGSPFTARLSQALASQLSGPEDIRG